jgi:TRAP-type C4-dicarboxylate transport system permease small subunit
MTAMKWLDGFSSFVNRVLVWFAGFALLAMLLLTVADMVLRASGVAVAGSYEVIGWLSASAMALALGAVQQHKGHVAVQLLQNRFGPRVKAAVDLLTCLLSLLLFVALAWYVAKYGQVLQRTGSLSETLRVVVYPWVYVVAVGCAGLALSLLVDFVRAVINLFVSHGRS